MSNATISLPGVDMSDCVVDAEGESVCASPSDDYIALAVGGKLPDDAVFIGKESV